MAKHILDDLARTIHPSASQVVDNLSGSLVKASALVQVMLDTGFYQHSHLVQYHYVWILSDLIDQAQRLSDRVCSK